MMNEIPVEITVACIAAIGSLIVAAFNAWAAHRKDQRDTLYRQQREVVEKERDRRDREREMKEDQRHAMDEALMDGVSSCLDALDISLIALQGGHLNGNVEAARERVASSARQMRKVKDATLSRIL